MGAMERFKNNPIFRPLRTLKAWTEALSSRPHAMTALFFLALVESSIFPIPPDVLLIAMCVSVPMYSLRFAAICTVGSVIGGIVGYAIGLALWYEVGTENFTGLAYFFFDHVPGFTQERFEALQVLFDRYDFWIVFAAGFTPIPYKIFTVASGVFGISFPMFVLASAIGRGGRFFLVAGLFHFFGAKIKVAIDKYFELLSLVFTLLLIGGFALIKFVI